MSGSRGLEVFPQLDSIVARGRAETIIPGASESYRLLVGDQELFYKVMARHQLSMLRRLERPVLEYMRAFDPQYFRIDHRSDEHIEREHRTIMKWMSAGITVVPELQHDKDSIIYPYVRQSNYVDLLENDPKVSIEGLLVTMRKTRSLAYEHQDSDYLHSDPHLENFLHNPLLKEAIPIDPGVVLRSDLPLESLDTGNNMFFLYSFFRPAIPKGRTVRYLEEAIDSFDAQAKERLREANGMSLPLACSAYLLAREAGVSLVKGKEMRSIGSLMHYRSRTNRLLINDILRS